jgi:hypothetical protein
MNEIKKQKSINIEKYRDLFDDWINPIFLKEV